MHEMHTSINALQLFCLPMIPFVISSLSYRIMIGKVGDMILLGWESKTSIWQKSAKLEGGGGLRLGVHGKSQVPHPLCGTLINLHPLQSPILPIKPLVAKQQPTSNFVVSCEWSVECTPYPQRKMWSHIMSYLSFVAAHIMQTWTCAPQWDGFP